MSEIETNTSPPPWFFLFNFIVIAIKLSYSKKKIEWSCLSLWDADSLRVCPIKPLLKVSISLNKTIVINQKMCPTICVDVQTFIFMGVLSSWAAREKKRREQNIFHHIYIRLLLLSSPGLSSLHASYTVTYVAFYVNTPSYSGHIFMVCWSILSPILFTSR